MCLIFLFAISRLMHRSQICNRAQSDADYHKSIATIFDIIEKWIHRTLDAAGDVNQDTSIDAFIDDPTPEQHLIQAIRGVRQFVERLASGRSLDGFFAALRVCGVDIQQDDAVRGWCDQFLAHLRRALDERGYVRSEEAQKRYNELRHEWRALLDKDSEEGRKWKEDIKVLRREARAFQSALDHDEDLTAVRRARARLGEDIENTLLTATKEGTQALMERAPWLWQDVFNVYLPQLAAAVKDIPIPRYVTLIIRTPSPPNRNPGLNTRTTKSSSFSKTLTSPPSPCSPGTRTFATSPTLT